MTYSFPVHSAGPFGDDINGRWFDIRSFQKLLAIEGTGWKDIHATTERAGERINVLGRVDELTQVTL
jgi:hypothetical protein